ncbi:MULTISPECIES: Asp23/Gls24 family envelope stress response protein [unclassified Caloramator]|uniref:Asp23/Gls24 family envelope stress response protein n=1 Tax=unclassified Caloramator TaxID=2629145 RepID=UPI00237EAC33|nr:MULTISPECIES: Asp23/Gls24 family envelope stress response protein [unclassified Caloramator]MDO6354135.1 Asp23/Gls24 family envelope stress response protein [Caloramator sp. CAR-1]WDU84069.1 Asp23/Gls24 family envelope stress response protein [Caloramator sp. Dgby_cultured_2]
MSVKIYNELGYIEFTDELIAKLAGAATTECYGVVGMASKRATDGLWELLKKEQLNKGVKVIINNDEIVIDLFIIVEYGTKIPVIAENIIEKVKYTIENFTGIKVHKVNVYVQDIRV